MDLKKKGKGEKENEKDRNRFAKKATFDFFRLMRMRQRQKSCFVTSDWWQVLSLISIFLAILVIISPKPVQKREIGEKGVYFFATRWGLPNC